MFYIQRQRSHNWDRRRGAFAIQSNSVLAGRATGKQENKYITEVLPQEWDFWAPHQAHQPGDLTSVGEDPRASGFEGRRGMSAGAPQDWGKQRLHSWRAHTRFHVHWATGQSSDSIGDWIRWTCGSWRVAWGGGGQLWLTVGGKDTGGGGPKEYSSARALPEVSVLATRPGPTQQPAGSSARTPQAKQTTEWEHSPTHQQIGCLKSPWAHSRL